MSAGSDQARTLMRRHVLLADLGEADFERIYGMARPVHLSAGQTLLEEGAPGDSLLVVVDGELDISRKEAGRDVVLATRGAGEFVGELSLLQRAPRSATARARTDSSLMEIGRTAFESLLSCSPSALLTILGTVTARLQSTEALLKQQEKMASLGTMAAGLAHELNNPAAAIRRSVEQLRGTVAELSDAAGALAVMGLTEAQTDAIRTARTGGAAGPSDALARAHAEEELQDWLEERHVDRAWEHAPVLAGGGLDRAALERLAGVLSAAELPAAIRWLAASAEVQALVSEAATSASAISSIVTAVKSYSRLDQAPIQDVDVHETLESTLVILKHKLAKGSTHVTRDYAPALPHIEAHGSELAQVWTNLIDNAIDATGGHGNITIRTRAAPAEVVVEISDDGPGISPEAKDHVFDPFFTTKEPGKGTGLGLHIVRNIVVDHHRGQIDLESRPGFTCFRVRLPLRMPKR